MNILLVDDEQLQLTRLEDECKKVLGGENIFSYTNPSKVLQEHPNADFDIAFLDIEMPLINGIKLAKSLKAINPKIRIIFVTAYNEYALDAYKIHASGYITKPVSEEKIKEEVAEIEHFINLKVSKKIQIKCFGNFELFHNGEPIKFSYQKSKEVFAYLVDREGALININELNAVLWEEDHKSYLRNLIADIQQSLKAIGCQDIFIKKHNGCAIDISKVDCDAYEYKKDNPDAVMSYRGEYMAQYSWPIFNGE